MSCVRGIGMTAFGSHPGSSTLSLMRDAANLALSDAELDRRDIDGLIVGYSTTMPHLMLATVFAEHFGLQPEYCHGIQVGGATGLAMIMLAHELVTAGRLKNILVVGGENRLTGQSRDSAIQTLAQVGQAQYEVPLGTTIPAYYALVASEYLHRHHVDMRDAAALAVQMRKHGARHPGAHYRTVVTEDDVLASREIATPLRLLDCCPISDGAAAVIISAENSSRSAVRILGCGQAHQHQHVSAIRDPDNVGAARSVAAAERSAGVRRSEIGYAGIYDSFTITLMLLLEEIGLAERGQAGKDARVGRYDLDGACPLNTHGGLLSYGHCGVAGGMAHFVEAEMQMTGRATGRQTRPATLALLHADGGVLSSHVSMFLERTR